MASIHKRAQSRYWYAAFTGSDGKRMFVSTKQADKRQALPVALEFERMHRLARRGELTAAVIQKIGSDALARVGGETLQTTTIEAHFKSWLAGKEANRSAGTARRYQPIVASFLASLGTRATKPLTALTPRDVELYTATLAQRGLCGRTVGLHLIAIGTALKAAMRQGIIASNVAQAVDRPRVVEHTQGSFTDTEIGILLNAAEPEWQTLILTAYYTGMRQGDCATLEWSAVDLTGGRLRLAVQKTGRKLEVPLHKALLAHLEKQASADTAQQYITPTLAETRHDGRRGLSRSFLAIMRKAGLAPTDADGNKRTFHSLRHGFTSRLANAGVSAESRMRLTGHRSARVHQGYTHLELDTQRAAVDKLPSLK